MAPGRIRCLLSRAAGTPRRILRGLGRRLRVGEQRASLTQECSDHDGTDSSELTGVNHVISPIQVASTQRPENETLVAGPELPVIIPLGPHEEVGDTHLSVCVHSDIICGEQYLKLDSDNKAEVVKVTPQETQDGPFITTTAVYATHSEEDGYLGDGESSKGDDSDDCVSDLGERDPADGAECHLPLKDERSVGEGLDKCNGVIQIPEESPKLKTLPASEFQYNMQGYLNLQDQTDLYNSGVLQTLISKQSPQKDLQKLGQLSRTPPPPSLSSPLPTPPQSLTSPLVPAQPNPPEKPPVRASHKRKNQSSISTAKKIPKKCNSKQQGSKKRKSQKKKKRRQRGRIISCGNSLSKAQSFGFTSQSQGQSHTNNKGSDSACTGQVTRKKKCIQRQDGRSSSSSSGGKRSSGESKSEIDSSGTSSDSDQPKKERKTKKHPQDKEHKSSSKFETTPEDVSSNASNMKEGPSMAFVSGSELELSSKPQGKASDRESLSPFASPKAKRNIKKRKIGGSKGLSKTDSAKQNLSPAPIGDLSPVDIGDLSPKGIGDLPPAATADYQPAGINELQPADINELQPAAIGGLPPTGIGDHQPGDLPPTDISDHQPGDLPPWCIPFPSRAEEKPVTQPLLHSSTINGLRALLVPNGIMPIHVHHGPSGWLTVEQFLEVCAVGDQQLVLSAVKVLGALLHCKLCFINCGQPSVTILPAISVLYPEGCEWSLAVNVTACDAGTPETFRGFAMEIVRLLSNLLEKWQAFHILEREPPWVISLLQRVKTMIEGALEGHPIPSHLLYYLVFRVLIPNMK